MEIQLSSLYGQNLYTDKGVYVGKIDDVSLDIAEKRISGIVVKNVNPNAFTVVGKKKGVIIPYRWVTALGDVVIIKHVKRRVADQEPKREKEAESKQ